MAEIFKKFSIDRKIVKSKQTRGPQTSVSEGLLLQVCLKQQFSQHYIYTNIPSIILRPDKYNTIIEGPKIFRLRKLRPPKKTQLGTNV